MNSRGKIAEFIRFAMVGVAATAIHYGVYLSLLGVMEPSVAYTLGYVVSFVCNYFLSVLFTFRTRPTLRRFLRFALSHAVNYVLQMVLFILFLWMGVVPEFVPVIVYAIAVPVNFLLVRMALKRKS